MLRHASLGGFIFALVVSACYSMPEPDVAPPATIASARRLVWEFAARYDQTGTTLNVQACLSNGACVTSEVFSRANCYDYSGVELTFDGALISQLTTSGYSKDGQGCEYPIKFKAGIPRQQIVPGGPHQLVLRIAGETVSMTIGDILQPLHITFPSGKLIKGSTASVAVDPRPHITPGAGLRFFYDSPELNDQWSVAKHGWHGLDTQLADVIAEDWTEQSFSFAVPTNMPSGIGTLTVSGGFLDSVPCPFARCSVGGGGFSVDIPKVEVIQ